MDLPRAGDRTRQGRPVDPSLGPRILEAVIDVIAESGYAAMTTAVVARRAGVSTATLYRRWPTRRDLVLAAASAVGNEEKDVDTGSTAGDLRAMLEHKNEVLSGRVVTALLSLIAESAHDAELAGVVRGIVYRPTRDALAAILARAHDRGDEPAVDADRAALVVVGSIMAAAAFRGDGAEVEELFGPADIDLLVRALTRT
ncbi:TetR/AcrR family transcriptional regulator [Georgenia sp. Z1344]|uniref:TetR/AcrR family transcriptional regulator n=1 Tax=Georgenia sp. Z1344 TaxID=3416706 RepID=UPI003CF266D2